MQMFLGPAVAQQNALKDRLTREQEFVLRHVEIDAQTGPALLVWFILRAFRNGTVVVRKFIVVLLSFPAFPFVFFPVSLEHKRPSVVMASRGEHRSMRR